MSQVTATLTVDFTSNYTGDHRVCWRLVGDPTYDCSTIVNCTGGGNTCQAVILVPVDTETCADPILFEGYTQAVCEAEGSVNGRDPFSTQVTGVIPDCERIVHTCVSGLVGDVSVGNPGSGYDNTTTGTITGDGTGATVTVTVAGGVVTDIVITNPGTGYTNATITINGIGTGATGNLTLHCEPLEITDCSGNVIPPIDFSYQLGAIIDSCSQGGSVTPSAGWTTVIDGNCLCDCINATLTPTTTGAAGTIDVVYTLCNGDVVQQNLATGSTPINVCIVKDSITAYNESAAGVQLIIDLTTDCPAA